MSDNTDGGNGKSFEFRRKVVPESRCRVVCDSVGELEMGTVTDDGYYPTD